MSEKKPADEQKRPSELPANKGPQQPLNESLLGINRLRPSPLGNDGRQGSLDGVTMLRPPVPPTSTPATPPATPINNSPPTSQGDT